MDTITVGLAKRFDWLQQGIAAFSLFNKIEYAKGKSDGFLPSLDDVWGKLYDLPRLTGESDEDYRARLQTYVKVLTGSGTIPNCQEVIDFLIGISGVPIRGTQITSLWPARALIEFGSVDAMRQARSRQALLESVLPGMFAAGVDYELLIPYQDIWLKAAIRGDATKESAIRAAVATENELSIGIDAIITMIGELKPHIIAAVQADRGLSLPIRAAVRTERDLHPLLHAAIAANVDLPISIYAAIMTQRELICRQKAAIRVEQELSCSHYAAVARSFDLPCGILARITHTYELPCGIKAAAQARKELTIGIRARIARSS
jgi:hypothetical protein